MPLADAVDVAQASRHLLQETGLGRRGAVALLLADRVQVHAQQYQRSRPKVPARPDVDSSSMDINEATTGIGIIL